MSLSRSLEYAVVDVFTRRPLRGNPVAVFTDAGGLSSRTMQAIASSLNLSETCFLLPSSHGADHAVRIFTPVNELPFAGHPTLGTAFLLGESHARDVLRLETAWGLIHFQLRRSRQGRLIAVQMQAPWPTWQRYSQAAEVLQALALERSTLPIEMYLTGPRHVFVGLPDLTSLAGLRPDLRGLAALSDVAINCFAGSGQHWQMRMFSPAYGVQEDAATGSAAGPLALHLIRHGQLQWGQRIEIRQGAAMGRAVRMYAQAERGRGLAGQLYVTGQAVVLARGCFVRY